MAKSLEEIKKSGVRKQRVSTITWLRGLAEECPTCGIELLPEEIRDIIDEFEQAYTDGRKAGELSQIRFPRGEGS